MGEKDGQTLSRLELGGPRVPVFMPGAPMDIVHARAEEIRQDVK